MDSLLNTICAWCGSAQFHHSTYSHRCIFIRRFYGVQEFTPYTLAEGSHG